MCDCIRTIDKLLADKGTNTQLVVGLSLKDGPSLATITTRKLDPSLRGKPVIMYATYCPFCGQKYEVEYEDTTDKEVERRR